MSDKPKCSACNVRDVFSKGLCSGCYGKQWRERRKAERVSPKQLTDGAIEGEIINEPADTHLVATSPIEMQAAGTNLKAWLEDRLTIIERCIVEANAALTEARRNGWATQALTSARNRAVDDETYYNKILAAVEAGHTIIPDFPISVFAVRANKVEDEEKVQLDRFVEPQTTAWARPTQSEALPAGAGEYRNPKPEVVGWWSNFRKNAKGEDVASFNIRRTGRPSGPISFPSMTARSPIMRATANAMDEKVFDQIGVCHPTVATAAARQVTTNTARAGDPLVIGQILHKRVGSKQKVVSFIIAWYLNLEEL